MKRFLTLSLSALMICGALTACGGSLETDSPAPTETSAPADTAAAAITFEQLQENYTAMVDAYNAVKKAYENDAVAADPNVEATLNKAADLISEMSERTEDQFESKADIDEMNDAILDIINVLDATADILRPAAEGVTFADLQEDYSAMVDSYNTVKDAVEKGVVTPDEDQLAAINKAADLINELGELEESDFASQDDINTVDESIVTLDETLAAIAASLS